MKKKIIKWLIWGILAALIVFFVWQRFAGRSDKNAPEAYHVGRGSVIETVSESGILQPVEYVNLSFEMPTVLEWVGVDVGDHVTQGQILARVDRDQLAAQIASARIGVEQAIEAEKLARRKWDLMKPEQRENVKKDTAQARTQLAIAQAGWRKTQLIAPISGVVTAQNARVGEIMTGTALRIINPDTMRVEVLISETDVPKLSVGQQAELTFDAIGNTTFDAHITRIDPEATIVQDVTYYKAILHLARYDDRMRPGMSVDVDFIVSQQHDVVTVPLRFVRADDTGNFVYVRNADDATFDKRYIELGSEGDSGNVHIRSGLQDGEEIFAIYDKDTTK